MSSKINQIFIDISILVEFKKRTSTEFLLDLLAIPELELAINPIVLSEYLFICWPLKVTNLLDQSRKMET